MAILHRKAVARDLRAICEGGSPASLGDAELLERFATAQGDRAELAFAALVGRHGPMVLRACRSILRDGHDAEDAFQATFLLLARRARTLWVRDSLAPWLHSVACRIAAGTRTARARRRALERRAAGLLPASPPEPTADDLGAALHAEIERLPERLKGAVVLCYLQGLTHDEAAARLGCPLGTVRSRLSRGRDRLRLRLGRLGLAPPAPSKFAAPAVPLALATTTARAAAHLVAAPASAGLIAHGLLTLTQGASIAMLHPLKAAVVLIFATGAVAVGVTGAGPGQDPKAATTAPGPEASGALPQPASSGAVDAVASSPEGPAARPQHPERGGTEPPAVPVSVLIEQYKRSESALFDTQMDLAKKEPLALKLRGELENSTRNAENIARSTEAEVSRQLLADPDIKALYKAMNDAKARTDEIRSKIQHEIDPTLIEARDRWQRLEAEYNAKWALRKDALLAAIAYRKAATEGALRQLDDTVVRLREVQSTLKAELAERKREILQRHDILTEAPLLRENRALADRNAQLDQRLKDMERKLDALAAGPKPGQVPIDVDKRILVKIRPRVVNCLVEQVFVEAGQSVKKGDPLFSIQSADLAQAKNDCRVKFVQWDHDLKYLAAREPLAKEGRITQIIWTDTQNDEKKSRLDYMVSRSKLAGLGLDTAAIDRLIVPLGDGKNSGEIAAEINNQADLDLASKMTICAPMDAHVLSRDVAPGNFYEKSDILLILVPTKPGAGNP